MYGTGPYARGIMTIPGETGYKNLNWTFAFTADFGSRSLENMPTLPTTGTKLKVSFKAGPGGLDCGGLASSFTTWV
jgi:hypothetical protein